MGIKHQLTHSLHQLLQRDNSGSYATRYDRQLMLQHFIKSLVRAGYKLPHVQHIKQKHIEAVVAHWQQQQLSNATLKNRLSVIRHLALLLNKPQVVPSNQALGIGKRQYVAAYNRALIQPDFSRIRNSHIKISLELQRVFGLRREESLKIKPHLADKKDKIELLPSWCKGGRGRTIPIRTEEQRYWLEQAKAMVLKINHSLIPPGKTYIQQRYVYDKQVTRAGLCNLHGLRHAYAQQRYKELTGWEAPINGGSTVKQLTPEQRQQDLMARMILTEELWHSREQITVSYLGR